MTAPRRPLRSVLIGDIDFYNSEFVFGVHQGMTLLGHWHTTVSVRLPIEVIAKKLMDIAPDIIWGHMLLWSPRGDLHAWHLLALCKEWRQRGARVLIHDGDAREDIRFGFNIETSVDVALCNHTADRSDWGVAVVRWPYFAFVQSALAPSVPEFMCALAFAGRLGGGIYVARTVLVEILRRHLGAQFKCFPSDSVPYTLFRTPELAASAGAVLGHGRPDSPGWIDVRVFQYPGAGGVLLHDDVGGFLEPWEHYIPYQTNNVDSVLEGVSYARERGPAIRVKAFDYVQNHHTSVHRVRQALASVGLQ